MFCNLFKIHLYPNFKEDGGGTGSTGGTGGTGGNSDPNNPGSSKGEEKTFTQEDLNRVGANEKRQGIASILKTLGFESETKAQEFVKKYRQQEEDKKDDLTKAQDDLALEKKAKEEAEKKAELADKKYKVVSMGVPANNVEDIVTLATAKVVDGKTFDTALEELKTSYPTLFSDKNPNTGTGTGGTHLNTHKKDEDSSLGKRLAEQRKNTSATKSTYFSN